AVSNVKDHAATILSVPSEGTYVKRPEEHFASYPPAAIVKLPSAEPVMVGGRALRVTKILGRDNSGVAKREDTTANDALLSAASPVSIAGGSTPLSVRSLRTSGPLWASALCALLAIPVTSRPATIRPSSRRTEFFRCTVFPRTSTKLHCLV